MFPDCTGESTLNVGPVLIEVKFVLADHGRQSFGIESRQLVAKGIPVGGIVCDIPAGREVLPQLHADNIRLR